MSKYKRRKIKNAGQSSGASEDYRKDPRIHHCEPSLEELKRIHQNFTVDPNSEMSLKKMEALTVQLQRRTAIGY